MPATTAALALGLYESLLDEGGVLPALGEVARRVGASSHFSHIISYRRGRPQGTIMEGMGGLSASAREDYARFWVRHDPRATALANMPAGVYDMAELVSAETFANSRFWREWGAPNGAAFHSLSVPLLRDGDRMGCVVFLRRQSEAPFDPTERQLLERLFPHLQRVFTAEGQLAETRRAPPGLWRGIDALPDGVALVDATRGLSFANLALQRIAAQNDGMVLGGPTGLVIADPRARLALARAVQAAFAAAGGRVGFLPLSNSVAVPRPSDQAPWLVRALPLPGGRPGALSSGVGALLLVTDPNGRTAPAASMLAQLFSLTPAEAALGAALAAGRKPEEHAQRRGISFETVRSQLAAIRRKTGCHSQGELAALLGRLRV